MKELKTLLLTIIFSLPTTSILIHLDEFAFPLLGSYSDLTITHYPNAIYLLRSLADYGQIPLWSNAILSGYPFAANPLAGIWYPFGWLAYIWPLPTGFNLAVVVHLIFGAFGMFVFLKKMGFSDLTAIMGGLAFECLPRLWSHNAAGHLTLVYAFCWSPWLLWSELSDRTRSLFVPGVILGMIFLADVRWAAYAGLLWLAFKLSRMDKVGSEPLKRILARLIKTLVQPLLGLALSALLLIPMIEYLSLSTRQDMVVSDNLIFSLQGVHLIGLIFPDVTGYVEWIVYPGALSIIAFLWSWLDNSLRRKTRFLRWGILLSIVLSLGDNFAPTAWLFSFPGFDLLRVPSRFMLVGGFLFLVLMSEWLKHLLFHFYQYIESLSSIRLGLVGMCVFAGALTISVWMTNSATPVTMIWGTLVYLGCICILFFHFKKPIAPNVLGALLFIFYLTDVVLMNSIRTVYLPRSEFLSKGNGAAEFISKQDGKFRVYSPSYSVPQQIAANFTLELADGIDPLQLRSYIRFFESASGIEQKGYSVTTPPFRSANPSIDNKDFIPDASRLGLLNVKYVAAEFPIQVDGLLHFINIGGTRIYENLQALPRAWVQNKSAPLGEMVISEPEGIYTPNHIRLRAEGPGLLVLSEIDFPGWKVYVDGQEGVITTAEVFRSLELKSGLHTVEFYYSPPSLVWGLGISGVTIIFLVINILIRRKNDYQV